MTTQPPLTIACYSDILCVWAYGLQPRVDALHQEFGKAIRMDHHFIAIFGNTDDKVVGGWEKQGGPAAYGAHVRGVAERLGGVEVHPEIWVRNRPATSLTPHLVLEAIRLLRDRGELDGVCGDDFGGRCLVEEAAWQLRLAFFRDLRDVGRMDVVESVVARSAFRSRPCATRSRAAERSRRCARTSRQGPTSASRAVRPSFSTAAARSSTAT